MVKEWDFIFILPFIASRLGNCEEEARTAGGGLGYVSMGRKGPKLCVNGRGKGR